MASPPHNFSWIEPHKLAGMAMPQLPAHYQYLYDNGIQHLVTLCERKPPYRDSCPAVKIHHIKIDDFCSPSFEQIERFLAIVEEANAKGERSHLPWTWLWLYSSSEPISHRYSETHWLENELDLWKSDADSVLQQSL
ncbi:dual specificity protein phosphatase 23b isoform X2 [Carcharodon carcharias]|uniref:dual specificity protein phosphatase 23b isoform X2 n=1 Tax=Carcharodon carcharias TaxID=13397 RepID=UPI001B7EA6A1|nr:dual specificity protein phosphatase 23b isoform X2 [Carcharodon carcharias]